MSFYGHCPQCGGSGVSRERRLKGNDRCENGHSYPSKCSLKSAKAFEIQAKTHELLDKIVWSSFLSEDASSRDYCVYCYREYGNYEKFGHAEKTVQQNHKPDCIYRLAVELLEELEQEREPIEGV